MKLVSISDEVFHEKKASIYSNKEDILIDVTAGIPFEVPEDLGQARIKASPNHYREATEEDEAKAKEILKAEVERLNKLIDLVEDKGFDPKKFLLKAGNQNEAALKTLERGQLLAVGKVLQLEFPSNISSVKLISLILEKLESVNVEPEVK